MSYRLHSITRKNGWWRGLLTPKPIYAGRDQYALFWRFGFRYIDWFYIQVGETVNGTPHYFVTIDMLHCIRIRVESSRSPRSSAERAPGEVNAV